MRIRRVNDWKIWKTEYRLLVIVFSNWNISLILRERDYSDGRTHFVLKPVAIIFSPALLLMSDKLQVYSLGAKQLWLYFISPGFVEPLRHNLQKLVFQVVASDSVFLELPLTPPYIYCPIFIYCTNSTCTFCSDVAFNKDIKKNMSNMKFWHFHFRF